MIACQTAYTRPFLATRSETGSRRPPADWLVNPCMIVPGAGTAGPPAGALSVRSTNGFFQSRQPPGVFTRAVPLTESGASVPVSRTRTMPARPSRVRPEAVNEAPSGVEPETRTTML
jgi:hypothetical protein